MFGPGVAVVGSRAPECCRRVQWSLRGKTRKSSGRKQEAGQREAGTRLAMESHGNERAVLVCRSRAKGYKPQGLSILDLP